ncbi:MAG: hypothetical protein V4582_00175 [Pseudomonadota bacterium]
MRPLALLLLSCFLFLPLRMDSAGGRSKAPHPALAALPATLLWAWERPEDLRWLPPDMGVAYVASSIVLRGDETLIYPRRAPLLLSPGSARVPVLHVDASWRNPPTLSEQQRERITQELLRVAARANRHVVQLDFEVRQSQRPFLAATIASIRRQLDARVALSVTALASWCLDARGPGTTDADEVVPMAFRMGQQQGALRQRLLRQQGFDAPQCASAIGFASDEARMQVRAPRHYYFSPQPWSAASWNRVASQSPSTLNPNE